MVAIEGKKISSKAQMRRFGEVQSGKVPHQRIMANGILFDSKAEHDRYLELLCMQRAGVISALECHPRYEIIPAQRPPGRHGFQAAHYTADFKYIRAGKEIVEDVKSSYTREDQAYILRRKLMYLVHGIYVEEVVR